MADLKISQLTGATTPLAGTEVLPIIQSGVTKQVSVANLTTGRAVAMAGGAFSDNFTQGTAAKGVNFTANTPAAGMTSQLLNWYEEGTWTPAYKSSNNDMTIASYNLQDGTYTRIGRMVICNFRIATNTVTSTGTGNIQISGLPFTSKSSGPWGTLSVGYSSNGFLSSGMVDNNSTIVKITGQNTTSAQSSIYEIATTNFGGTGGYGNYIIGCVMYTV